MQLACIDTVDNTTITHHKVDGDAFAFSNRSKLAVCGGNLTSNLINIYEPDKFYKQNIKLNPPLKYIVSSYEWDPFNDTKYIQNRNKIIELVDIEIKDLNESYKTNELKGHSDVINVSKWSPFRPNIFVSCANDSYIYIWNTDLDKPIAKEHSIGGAHCLAWSKIQENIFSITSNNDVKIYDLRKLNSTLRYIPNAHSKRISSIDWCSVEDKFIVCGRDKTIRIWNFNSLEEKLNPIKIDDFSCWKAKFLPHSSNFIVIPTCSSITSPNKSCFNTSYSKQLSPTIINANTTATTNTTTDLQINCKFAIGQFNTSNQLKINKYHSNRADMITNFDFYHNEENNLVAWTKDQCFINFPLDLQYATIKTNEDKVDLPARINILNSQQSSTNLLQHQSITCASSRKSSFSDNNYGSPNLNIGIQALIANQSLSNSNYNDSIQTNLQFNLNVQTKPATRMAEIIPYPKCFCAKFSGLPQHLLVFQNKNQNQYKTYPKQYEPQYDKFTDKKHKKSLIIKQPKSRVKTTAKKSRVYIIDMSDLISIRYDLAVKYTIMHPDNKAIAEKNYEVSLIESKGDIPKIWELLQFITTTQSENISLNPDHGRPWSCSTFGRPLVNYIIENCMKIYDIQTIVMVIAKLLQYDKSLVPIPSSVQRQRHNELCEYDVSDKCYNSSTQLSLCENSIFPFPNVNDDDKSYDSSLTVHHKNIGLLDPDRTTEYDFLIKYYCDILYRWGLHIKRAELYEFIHDKPSDFDEKFECPNRCKKCRCKTTNSRCYSSECKKYNIYCSLCQLPVNGLSITCIICGHGGHYEHLVDWFKKQDDCAAACGCKCTDFI